MSSSPRPTNFSLQTEARNPATENIDLVPTLEMVKLMNLQDQQVALAVSAELPQIAQAIEAIAERMRQGGRLIYLGAGTSGRLGVLDASESVPTFNLPPNVVIGVIAGGERALTHPGENAEDDVEAGVLDIAALEVSAADSVVGIAASGQTPYTISGMGEARRRGALVINVACNHPSPMAEVAEISITPLTGPEVLNGSTRLKAGTAQKMVLNMLSTGTMIRLGKTYSNLMVDVQPHNIKLKVRARRIVEQACELGPEAAAALLEACGGEVKVAIVSHLGKLSPEAARSRLDQAGGFVRQALQDGASQATRETA